MFCATWYHLYNFKNLKNTHGGVLLQENLQACFMEFFHVFNLYKWFQIAQRISYMK